MKYPLSLALVATLSACGGGGGSGGGGGGGTSAAPKPTPVVSASEFDTFNSFKTAYDAFEAEKTGQFHTAFVAPDAFPDSGTARFEGMWQNTLDAAGTPTVLLGRADVDVNFAGGGTLSGTVDDFVGQVGGGATDFYSGTVTLSNGEIGKDGTAGAQNDLRFDYGGTLTGNAQTVVLNGSNNTGGKFLQTPITGIEATGSGTATINSVTVTDDMGLYADRQ